MGEDDEGGCQSIQSKPEDRHTTIFRQRSDSDDNYPDDIDEFEYDEDGYAIFPF